MKNKTIAKFTVAGVALAIVTGIFESSLAYSTSENLYTLSGLTMIVFGIWGSVRLWKSEE